MKKIRNTENTYGLISICLHWIIAILLFLLLGLGIYMVSLHDVGFNSEKIILILFHKEVGMLILFLVFIRFIWRLNNVLPSLSVHLPDWQKITARFVHLCFYALMFSMPITGLMMSSAAGIPVSFFGLFTFPDLISQNWHQFQMLIEIHKWLGYAFLFLIFIHVGAALRHHFIFKDDTLQKILW